MGIQASELQFKILSNSDDLTSFVCSDQELNEYLKEDALVDQLSKLSVTRLAYSDSKLIGFFTLVNASIRRELIRSDDGAERFDYPHYPAIKIARLATDRQYERNGIGKAMLLRSMAISTKISEHVGCRFIIVDAKNNSVNYYAKFGFVVAKARENTTAMYRNIPHESFI